MPAADRAERHRLAQAALLQVLDPQVVSACVRATLYRDEIEKAAA